MSRRLYVFGTGHAMVTRLYNSCFALEEDGRFFLLDAGGGSGILQAAAAMGVPWDAVRFLFLTHTHTDHLLGGVWAVRAVGSRMCSGQYPGEFTVWGHHALIDAFRTVCRAVLSPGICALLDRQILLQPVEDGAQRSVLSGTAVFFDTGCTQVRQFGCAVRFPDGQRLAYLGDEPIHPQVRPLLSGCGYLIAEALCLESERQIHRPEASFHSSVKETCERAEALGVRHLILCHTEDTHGPARRALYTAEGGRWFSGTLLVPDDREIVPLA